MRSGSLERVRFSLHCFSPLHLTLDLLIGHLADSEWLSFSKLLSFAGVWFLLCIDQHGFTALHSFLIPVTTCIRQLLLLICIVSGGFLLLASLEVLVLRSSFIQLGGLVHSQIIFLHNFVIAIFLPVLAHLELLVIVVL